MGIYWLSWGGNLPAPKPVEAKSCPQMVLIFLWFLLHYLFLSTQDSSGKSPTLINYFKNADINPEMGNAWTIRSKNIVGDNKSQLKRELRQWRVNESTSNEHDAIWQGATDLCSEGHVPGEKSQQGCTENLVPKPKKLVTGEELQFWTAIAKLHAAI